MNTPWHSDPRTRRAIGDDAEKLFAAQVRCHCGGEFDFIGTLRPGFPDFTCMLCGQLVDVKASPQAERTGNISVSVRPWEGYPDDMLLVTVIGGRWLGEYKRNICLANHSALDSTHAGTKFHLVAWSQFKEISEFGFVVKEVAP